MVEMWAIAIMLSATYAAAGQQKGKNDALRVLGGVDDTTNKYPYVVALKGPFPILDKICTGSFIKDTWVLSAAHCLLPFVKYVQYGNMSKQLELSQSKSIVLKMICHPAYSGLEMDARYTYGDIGLLMVERVIGMSKYARISAVDYRTLLGQPIEYAGYGKTYIHKRDVSMKMLKYIKDIFRPLQIGEGVVTPCEDKFRKALICARAKCSNSKQMVLPGDSGGPLMFDNKIVGVAFAVWYETFDQSFTPVSPFLPWIHTVVKSIPQNVNTTGRTASIAHITETPK